MKSDKIYLVGFMAAGKTSVARALAQRLSWRFFDIDEEIEARESRSVADLFASKGEAYFRAIERQVLQEVLDKRYYVVATGGGTFADPSNRAAILADGCSVWLDVTFRAVVFRLPADGRRPLASSRAQMEALYHARRPYYEQAHVRIDASSASIDAIVEEILHSVAC
jgi:shikimate kinase